MMLFMSVLHKLFRAWGLQDSVNSFFHKLVWMVYAIAMEKDDEDEKQQQPHEVSDHEACYIQCMIAYAYLLIIGDPDAFAGWTRRMNVPRTSIIWSASPNNDIHSCTCKEHVVVFGI